MPGENEEVVSTGGEPAGTGVVEETGYEKGTVEDTATRAFREITSRGVEEEPPGDPPEEDAGADDKPPNKTVKVKEHVRNLKGPGQQAPTPGEKAPTDAGKTDGVEAMPSTWKPEHADAYKALTPALKAEIHRREADARNGVAMYKRDADFGRELAGDLIHPYINELREVATQNKLSVKEIARGVMDGWKTLVRGTEDQKREFILQLEGNFLQTPIARGAPRDGGQQQPGQQDDPRLADALRQIGELRGNLQAYEIQREQAEGTKLRGEWEVFRADPANEFVDTLFSSMQQLLNAGVASNYREAYDKAAALDPTVRDAMAAKDAEKRKKDDAERASAAKKAAGTNVAHRGTAAVAPKAGSMEDTLRSSYRKIMAAGG